MHISKGTPPGYPRDMDVFPTPHEWSLQRLRKRIGELMEHEALPFELHVSKYHPPKALSQVKSDLAISGWKVEESLSDQGKYTLWTISPVP